MCNQFGQWLQSKVVPYTQTGVLNSALSFAFEFCPIFSTNFHGTVEQNRVSDRLVQDRITAFTINFSFLFLTLSSDNGFLYDQQN